MVGGSCGDNDGVWLATPNIQAYLEFSLECPSFCVQQINWIGGEGKNQQPLGLLYNIGTTVKSSSHSRGGSSCPFLVTKHWMTWLVGTVSLLILWVKNRRRRRTEHILKKAEWRPKKIYSDIHTLYNVVLWRMNGGSSEWHDVVGGGDVVVDKVKWWQSFRGSWPWNYIHFIIHRFYHQLFCCAIVKKKKLSGKWVFRPRGSYLWYTGHINSSLSSSSLTYPFQ